MCRSLSGDVWALTVSPSFQTGFYFATAKVYDVTRKTMHAYRDADVAFERGLQVLFDLANEQGVVLDELVARLVPVSGRDGGG